MQHKLNQAGPIEFTDTYISKFKWLKYRYTSDNGARKNTNKLFMWCQDDLLIHSYY